MFVGPCDAGQGCTAFSNLAGMDTMSQPALPPEHARCSGKARSEFESLTTSVQRVLEGLRGGPAASLLEKDYALSDARALLPQSALMSAPFQSRKS